MNLKIPKDKAIKILRQRIAELSEYNFNPKAWKGKTENDLKEIFPIGSMQWLPNRDAIDALIRLHLPNQLVAKGWTLRLIGSGTDRYKNINGVDCAGFVEDINDEYRQAGMAICPIWSGAGANIKLATCNSYGPKNTPLLPRAWLSPWGGVGADHSMCSWQSPKCCFDSICPPPMTATPS